MNLQLIHPFLKCCFNRNDLLNDCVLVNTYLSRLEKQSQLFPDRYDPNDYKGDGFELFVEALIKLSPIDNRIGISNYQIVPKDKDTGVDGYGIGTNNKPATVNCKHRSKHDTLLTANEDHLSNFVSTSFLRYNVDPKDINNMLIVTSGEGLHFFTENEMYQNKVRCLGRKELRRLVDNNLPFWDEFRDLALKQ